MTLLVVNTFILINIMCSGPTWKLRKNAVTATLEVTVMNVRTFAMISGRVKGGGVWGGGCSETEFVRVSSRLTIKAQFQFQIC